MSVLCERDHAQRPTEPRTRERRGNGSRIISRHRVQSTAIKAGRHVGRSDHVEVVIQARDGRIREKDSEGRESQSLDS